MTERPPTSSAPDLRGLPSVHQLVERLLQDPAVAAAPRSLVTEAARRTLDAHRAALLAEGAGARPAALETLAAATRVHLEQMRRPPLAPVINATGIIIHTGLGRAPLAAAAVRAMADAAGRYAPVELDLAGGSRGSRASIVRPLLCGLTGAESATVVNNTAAALMVSLSALARDRHVIVSRGELVEIGGSFRLPDVMAAGGVKLREVGTTNRTRLRDYEQAIDGDVGAILKVHTSNFRVEGFTESVPVDELVALGRHHDIPVIDDIGSGALGRFEHAGIPAHEPDAASAVAAGADLVLFSGDKLLGGPQAGVIVGRSASVIRIERHPMMRAMRLDKVRLAGLAVTLQLHGDAATAAAEIPVLARLAAPIETLERRGRALVERLGALTGIASAELRAASAYLGGGAVPAEAVPSLAVVLRAGTLEEHELAERLRTRPQMPVVARVSDGAVWLDLRTVLEDQDEALVGSVAEALGQKALRPPSRSGQGHGHETRRVLH